MWITYFYVPQFAFLIRSPVVKNAKNKAFFEYLSNDVYFNVLKNLPVLFCQLAFIWKSKTESDNT
jgi:hypothetical protein